MHTRTLFNKRQHSGAALITALFVVFLATLSVVALAKQQVIEIRRTDNLINHDTAYRLATGLESWARKIIEREQARTPSRVTLGEPWASGIKPMTVDDRTISASIEDLQGRYNVNNLVDDNGEVVAEEKKRLVRLLQALELDAALADSLVDWLDTDINTTIPGGAEDTDYLRRKPPYRAANRRIASVSELLLVQGYTREVYGKIAPYLAALPESTAINVNTASSVVLMAAIEGLTQSGADSIVSERGENGFADVTEFRNQRALEGMSVSGITVDSRYFLVTTRIRSNNGYTDQVTMYSVLQRGQQAGDAIPAIYRSTSVF
jgi:general secretion pathway protein K